MDGVQDKESTDDLLIERARRGDREAQAKLLRAMQDRWFRFAYTQLGDEDKSRDAVQETAVRVLQKLSTFDRRSTFSTWSIGICLNVCREQRRRRTGRGLEDISEPAAASEDHPELERQESLGRMKSVLADLPERQREALVLRFFEGHSVQETAILMRCAAGTVKATVHQALRAMRERLGV